MKLAARWPLYQEAFIRIFYPSHCGLCHAFLRLEENGICRSCRQRLQALRHTPEEACHKQSFETLDEVWSLYPYESPVKELITAVKFLKKRWLLKVFTEDIQTLASALGSETAYDAIVPIPLSGKKLMEREFNQTELIAEIVEAATQIPIQRNLLSKRFHGPAQSQLTKEEREINPMGAFGVSRTKQIEGKTYLLVDDIITTGATGNEAARMLKNHGAKRVDLLTLACTPRTR